MIENQKIRLDILETDGLTAGWIVRRACNAFQAFVPSGVRPESGVVDLLTDGLLIGQACDLEGARDLIEANIDYGETSSNKILHVEPIVTRPSADA